MRKIKKEKLSHIMYFILVENNMFNLKITYLRDNNPLIKINILDSITYIIRSPFLLTCLILSKICFDTVNFGPSY